MNIFIPKSKNVGDSRVAMVPDTAAKLIKLGLRVTIEHHLGSLLHIDDDSYQQAGISITDEREGLANADAVLSLQPPTPQQMELCRKGTLWIGLLEPFKNPEIAQNLSYFGIDSIAMELIPRTTIAQKMDMLSSQASIAGYTAVLKACEHSHKIFPMMNTPSGTIKPARVLIIGAGVAGLQAIATAKRLGARVDAYDTRPNVKEQIESLGAKAVQLDIGSTEQTKDGYAKALTAEQLQKQRTALGQLCAQMDIIITTAQVFGGVAPTIITQDMLKSMKNGAVIVDLAIETGGNVESIQADTVEVQHGVKLVGLRNLPGETNIDASLMAANNFHNLIAHFWDKEAKTLNLNIEDEILASAMVTHQGQIVNSRINDLIQQGENSCLTK